MGSIKIGFMNKVCLVTGGTSALGKDIVSMLRSRGFRVYSPGSAELDITSDGSCVKYLKSRPDIDVLINIAGISPSGPVQSFSVTDLIKTMDINCIGPFRLFSLVLPNMVAQKRGRIINVSSLSGLASFPRFSIYSASKFALRGWGNASYLELYRMGIFVTTLFPGALNLGKTIPSDSARARIPPLRWLLPLTPTSVVADQIISLLESTNPPPEVVIGRDSYLINLLYRYLPSSIWLWCQKIIWQRQK